jgi:hypothetical protein
MTFFSEGPVAIPKALAKRFLLWSLGIPVADDEVVEDMIRVSDCLMGGIDSLESGS